MELGTTTPLAVSRQSKTAGHLTQNSEFGRKCSLDGTREILHLKKDESVREAMRWWETFAEREPKYCRRKRGLMRCLANQANGQTFSGNPIGIRGLDFQITLRDFPPHQR